MEMNNDIFTPNLPIPEPVSFEDAPIPIPVEEEKPAETPPPRRRHKADAPVLTIESGDEIETEDAREAAAWHEIHNAYRTRRILSAPLGGIEQTDSGKTIAVVDYNGFRIVIPLKEMMIAPSAANNADSMAVRQMKLLGNMLGAEIDFVILGIDSKSRSVVASRREAMMRKRQLFYFSPDANGEYRVREGRVVQARVIAVADKSIRVEIFGVECSIMARDLAWDWIGDAHDRFAVGDQILVRVTEVNKTSQEELSVHADVKSVTENTSREALKRCRVQSKYAGRVTDVHKGIVYVRLSNGVNAVAHSCYDRRTPGKKDDVSFVVTKLDEERSIAVGIITRIIRQNKEKQNTDPILSEGESVRTKVRDNIELDLLCHNQPESAPVMQEIYELVVETIQLRSPVLRLGNNLFPMALVRERLLQLTSEHIRFVLDGLRNLRTDVKNLKKYLLTMLFNAPVTLNGRTMLDVRKSVNSGFRTMLA